MLIHANAGPELGQRRVYLSPATLLVVPGTLIGHWEEQVQKAPLPMWPTLLQRHFLYLVGQAEAIHNYTPLLCKVPALLPAPHMCCSQSMAYRDPSQGFCGCRCGCT